MASLEEQRQARLAARKARVQAVVAEMLAMELAEDGDDSHETIDDIENGMVAIGDAVAREFGIQKLARRMLQSVPPPPCPQCGHASEDRGLHRRALITRRGEVPITETKCYCPKCRRNFFPQSAVLGIEKDYDYTPRVYRKIVFAASKNVSFQDASQALAELGEMQLSPKRVWRAAQRIGAERLAEQQAAAADYQALPLPAQQLSPVPQVPLVACVQMDGGRFQERERGPETEAGGDSHWREYKAGSLLSMTSKVHATDPCPQLPETFKDPGKMRKIASEIKGFTTSESAVARQAEEEGEADLKERPGLPEVLVKSVVATTGDVTMFGLLLVAAAYARGFHAALRKAFVCDGSNTNWSAWRKHFSHYTPITDFVHALMYVYAAAMSGGTVAEGWALYRDWAQWLWQGDVALIIAALEQTQQQLGVPEKDETSTPRAQLACTLTYLINQQERMQYHEYRRQGLPITSNHIESTIKQINRRIKGTEKFWDEGADPMLHLVADQVSQTNVIAKFWDRRTQTLIESASYQQAT